MKNPFDDESSDSFALINAEGFIVLVNDEGQYSLWPTFVDIMKR